MTARQALELSINIPTVRVSLQAGLPYVLAAARNAGIASRLRAYPSIALGAFEISPMEIAGAYGALANSGVRVAPERDRGRDDRRGPRPRPEGDAALCRRFPPTRCFSSTRSSRARPAAGRRPGPAPGASPACSRGRPARRTTAATRGSSDFSPRFLSVVWVGLRRQPGAEPLGNAGRGADLRGLLPRPSRRSTSRSRSRSRPTSSPPRSIRTRACSRRPVAPGR